MNPLMTKCAINETNLCPLKQVGQCKEMLTQVGMRFSVVQHKESKFICQHKIFGMLSLNGGV